MPRVAVIYFKESDGSVPAVDFLRSAPEDVRLKLFARVALLEEMGHELRRPVCENLGNGIYELRSRHVKTQYRLLYFFDGRAAVVISHGFTKEREMPAIEIKRAEDRRMQYLKNRKKHRFPEETEDD